MSLLGIALVAFTAATVFSGLLDRRRDSDQSQPSGKE
jgi:hypothetical protein